MVCLWGWGGAGRRVRGVRGGVGGVGEPPLLVVALLLVRSSAELIANPSFAGMRNWTVRCPNPALCPHFTASGGSLRAAGTNARDYAWAEGDVAESLELGASYCLSTALRWDGIEDPNRHVEVSIFSASNWNEGISGEWKNNSDGWSTATRRFTFQAVHGGGDGPRANDVAKVRLYFRFAATGSAEFRNISLTRCDPPPRRVVRVAAADGKVPVASLSAWLDDAGRQKVDFAVLPELFNGKDDPMSGAEDLSGLAQNGSLSASPSAHLMRSKAKQWGKTHDHCWLLGCIFPRVTAMIVRTGMHVSGTFYGREGEIVYNTALLFGRSGELVGAHRKNEVCACGSLPLRLCPCG